MLTMTPPPWAIICLPAHLQPRKTPFRLMPTTVFQPLIEMSSGFARKEAPALFTMTSSRRHSSAARSTMALTWSSCRTSTAIANERRPRSRMAFTTGSRCSSLREQMETSAPAFANSIAMDFPMPVPPPVTIAVLPSRENGFLAMAGTIPQRAGDVYGPGGAGASHGRLAPGRPVRVRSHLFPVPRLLEDLSSAIDGRLVDVLADEHHAGWQPVHHSARHRHGGMLGHLEGRRVADPLERPLDVLFAAGLRARQRRRLHRRGRHEQQVVIAEHAVVGRPEPPHDVHGLAVVARAVLVQDIRAEHQEELRRLRELVGAVAPVAVVVHQRDGVEIRPAEAIAVAPHHRLGEPLHADRRPDRRAGVVHGDGDLVDLGPQILEPARRGVHLLRHGLLAVRLRSEERRVGKECRYRVMLAN